jgi:hypothetical protein
MQYVGPACREVSKHSTIAQFIKKFLARYGTGKSITVTAKAGNLSVL